MIQILITAVLLLFSGCTQPYQSSEYKVDQFPSQAKSIVVIQMSPVSAEFDFVKIAESDGGYYPISDGNYYTTMYHFRQYTVFPFGNSNQIKVMMVDPGYYAITNIEYFTGNTQYSSNQYLLHSINSESFAPTWGGFYAPPGEVVYVGSLELKYAWRRNTFLFTHSYYEDYVRGFLQVKYPMLADMMEKGAFFPGGKTVQF